jgi:hypothetical protein
MIAYMQFSWLARVLAHWRLGSYLRGLIEAVLLAPTMLKARAGMHANWRLTGNRLWREILDSEDQARSDFTGTANGSNSIFLRWYFRIFR